MQRQVPARPRLGDLHLFAEPDGTVDGHALRLDAARRGEVPPVRRVEFRFGPIETLGFHAGVDDGMPVIRRVAKRDVGLHIRVIFGRQIRRLGQALVGEQDLGRRPGLTRARANRAVDDPHRKPVLLVQLAREKVRGRRKHLGFVRRADPPFSLAILFRSGRHLRFDHEEPYRGVVGRLDFRCGVSRLFQAHFHVGLPRGQPHVADQNILDDERVLTGHAHLLRFRRLPQGL
ncbi:MAG: hypothetical protein BWY57_02656 [Betaproteobacteria bacterium ADurb.Bin341]|nr:MAG: hypothetical protein BWY57_02656 [Betaproteobacteria bacterium ADurb.Bin341]